MEIYNSSFKTILIFITFTLILAIPCLVFYFNPEGHCSKYEFIRNLGNEDDGSLFLTEFIQKNQVEKGREKAFVGNWKGVKSYSGYLTVNAPNKPNMFFWFFPSTHVDPRKAPVILYLQGGPGLSSMIGLFHETGPFYLNQDESFEIRNHAWTEKHSMIYIDSPVSTGFSFGDDAENYPLDVHGVTLVLFEALLQFFLVFPEYRENEFFIAGTSYCGKYIPVLAFLIHTKNQVSKAINLKGLAIGGGYFDGGIQNKYADMNYFLGLIDDQQRKACKEKEALISHLIQVKDFESAREETLFLKTAMIASVSGWQNFLSGNALHPEPGYDFWEFHKFLELPCVKSAIHVGRNRTYFPFRDMFHKYSKAEYYRSTRPELEILLNANYTALIFASQFDLVVPHVGISDFLDTLSWNRGDLYAEAEREVWKVNGHVAGYVRQVPGLTYLLLRNAGHMPCQDNPLWCYEMINEFTSGRHGPS